MRSDDDDFCPRIELKHLPFPVGIMYLFCSGFILFTFLQSLFKLTTFKVTWLKKLRVYMERKQFSFNNV